MDDLKLITVYTASDPSLLVIAKSILEDAEILCLVKGEGVQDLFGVGQFGVAFNPITGPVEIQVRGDDKEAALELLKELKK